MLTDDSSMIESMPSVRFMTETCLELSMEFAVWDPLKKMCMMVDYIQVNVLKKLKNKKKCDYLVQFAQN